MTPRKRVRIMANLAGANGIYDQGDVLDLPEPEAASLVRAGYAIYIERVERPTMSPLERGDTPAQQMPISGHRMRGGNL